MLFRSLVDNAEVSPLSLLMNKFSGDRNIQQNSQLKHIYLLSLYLANNFLESKGFWVYPGKIISNHLSFELLLYCKLKKTTVDIIRQKERNTADPFNRTQSEVKADEECNGGQLESPGTFKQARPHCRLIVIRIPGGWARASAFFKAPGCFPCVAKAMNCWFSGYTVLGNSHWWDMGL